MAQKVSKEMLAHIVKSVSRAEYDWEKYTDGEWWALKRGEDYTAQTVSVRASAARWGRQAGYKVSTGLLKEGDGFALCMTPE
jgi:hypothetical protein